MTVFALFMSAVPTTAQLGEYVQNLKACNREGDKRVFVDWKMVMTVFQSTK